MTVSKAMTGGQGNFDLMMGLMNDGLITCSELSRKPITVVELGAWRQCKPAIRCPTCPTPKTSPFSLGYFGTPPLSATLAHYRETTFRARQQELKRADRLPR